MGVREVARDEQVRRAGLGEQVEHDLHVGLADGRLLDAAGLVERHVEEAGVLGAEPHHLDGRDGLGVADEGLDLLDLVGVHLGGLLLVDVAQDGRHLVLDAAVVAGGEHVLAHLDELEVAAHILVEDGHRPVGHVGHRDVVAVADERVQHAAHRDHVVVRVGAEDDHALLLGQLVAVDDALAEVLEHGLAQLVDPAGAVDEVVEVVPVEVAGVEPEDGLAGLLGQPDDGALGGLGRPLDALDQPRRLLTRELRGGRAVDVDRRVAVELEVGRRDLRVGRLLDGLAHDGRLVLAGRDQDDLAGVQDGANAHRDRLAGDVLLFEEVRRGVLSRDLVEDDQARPVLGRRAGLVEADVAAAPDAEQQQVQAARALDQPLVLGGVGLDLLRGEVAARNVDVLRRHVDVVEEVLPHEPVVALQAVRRHRDVLVDVERDHVREVEPLLLVHPDQLLVDADGCRAGGQTQHGRVAGARLGLDEGADLAGGLLGERAGVVEDEHRQALDAVGTPRLTRERGLGGREGTGRRTGESGHDRGKTGCGLPRSERWNPAGPGAPSPEAAHVAAGSG